MVFIQSLILYCLVILFFFGQLLRLNFGIISFPIIDLFIVSFAVINLLTKQKISNRPMLFFILFAWISFIINYFIFHYPITSAILYLIRLSCLLSFFIFPPKVDTQIKKFFIIALIANVVFGLIQYFIWPDLTYFKAIGWDDHLNRLVSTYFDPTFTGLIYLMFFIHLYFKSKNKYLLGITLIAIFLTYSRSTFLSLMFCGLFVSYFQKRYKIFIVSLLLVITAIILLPRPPGEGTKLERTSSIFAKNVNLKEGLSLFTTSPLIGRGYNNLPIIRNSASHSASGFDSSLLTILTTTGIIGLILFLSGFYKLFSNSSLEKQTMIVAIFVHSLFANSLLYPFTLLFLIFI